MNAPVGSPVRAVVVEVFIASPRELSDARDVVRDALHEWNATNGLEHRMIFLPRTAGDTPAKLERGQAAQAIINRDVLDRCEVLFAMFWSTFGTPTQEYPSGTAEEIELFLDRGKRVALYFSEAGQSISSINVGQLGKLKRFKAKMRQNGYVKDFRDDKELRDLVMSELREYAREAEETMPQAIIDDPRVERFRWERLEPELQKRLYERFDGLMPQHHLPQTMVAQAEVQMRRQDQRPIPLQVLREALEAFGLPSEDVTIPVDDEHLTSVQGRSTELSTRICRAVESGLRGRQEKAALGIYDCLSTGSDDLAGTADIRKCDVVLVPGARRGHRYRVDKALEIVQLSGATIILSGGHPSYDPDQLIPAGEADAMAYYLATKALDRFKVIKDTRAHTTSETLLNIWPSLVEVARLLRRPLNMIAVTSPYHMIRLLMLCDQFYAERRHVVGSVKGALSTASFGRNVFVSPTFPADQRRYGIGLYVQELFKLFGGRATGEF